MIRRARLALSTLALVLAPSVAVAQDGSNYHVLSNGGDAAFVGLGAGGTQTHQDGLLTFVAGEDLRGSRQTVLGDFGYRQRSFIESACVFNAPIGGPSQLALRFPALFFIELDGLNGNAPPVFTNPTCTLPGFPLGASGAVPYGTHPGSTASFVLTVWPSAMIGMPTVGPTLLVNNGLAGQGLNLGTATIIAGASASLPIASTGFCWAVQFSWTPSYLAALDDIDGWQQFLFNSGDDNQYWLMSDDEQNLWQSQSVATDSGATALLAFPANVDYALTFRDPEPVTVATIAPHAGNTSYHPWTTNVSNEYGVVLNPNGGFDVGRGSAAISLSGHAGVANPNTGVGNQDPSVAPGGVPSLGFATWDDGGDFNGSVRLTWLSIDLIMLSPSPANPATDPGVLKQGGTIRVPAVSAGFLQTTTRLCLGLFGHVTRPNFIDPYGPSGIFYDAIGGASQQVPLGSLSIAPACVGLGFNITYGTSGRKGALGAPGALTFDQSVAATSGTRQLFILE